MRVTVTYDSVERRFEKSGKCICGKRLKRARTFSQTINPWNKNEKGEPKNRYEILPELQREGDAWKEEPVRHDRVSFFSLPKEVRDLYNDGGVIRWPLTCGEVMEFSKETRV